MLIIRYFLRQSKVILSCGVHNRISITAPIVPLCCWPHLGWAFRQTRFMWHAFGSPHWCEDASHVTTHREITPSLLCIGVFCLSLATATLHTHTPGVCLADPNEALQLMGVSESNSETWVYKYASALRKEREFDVCVPSAAIIDHPAAGCLVGPARCKWYEWQLVSRKLASVTLLFCRLAKTGCLWALGREFNVRRIVSRRR